MTSFNVAAYGEGVMYPPNLAPNISAIQTAGWTSVIVSLFHINTAGDIYINDTKVFTGGEYIGSPDWSGQLQKLLRGQGSTIATLLASIGGGGGHEHASTKCVELNDVR